MVAGLVSISGIHGNIPNATWLASLENAWHSNLPGGGRDGVTGLLSSFPDSSSFFNFPTQSTMAGDNLRARFFELTTPRPKANTTVENDSHDDGEHHVRRRRWRFQAIPLVIFIILFLCVLIPFVSTNKKIGSLRFYRDDNGAVDKNTTTNLIISLSGMSTDNYEMTCTSVLNEVPLSVLSPDHAHIEKPFRIQVGTSVAVINDNTTYAKAPLVSKVPLLTGSLAWYPFDTYQMKLEIQTVIGAPAYNGSATPIPNFAYVVAMPDDFSWTYTVEQTKNEFDSIIVGGGSKSNTANGFTALTITVTRDFNIYMALVFIGIWSVTIAIGYIGSMSVIWKRRAPDNPVIFVSALFAVPTFRNTAPGKPPYGCLFDVLCTYFSICVILTFLLLVAFAYMKKPAPKPEVAKQQQQRRKGRKDDDTIPVATLDANGVVAGDVADVADVADAADAGDAGGDAGDAAVADAA
ncbi:Aste57867_14604 [Aphanomyces stellatus]|uniref:Aste57867_14604 protein n=1 Tax=Aphanomyces stellatus TaxID=120398 RepID=A0A485L222_9STRA|nr:hypothetical protein As57867_014550 [Aphanomyces stellatus]VFT91423.1 Aste57867_14604 [Aphanomyces stellatus]